MATQISSNLPPIYTIREFSQYFKSQIESQFNYVRLRGEVSGLKCPNSGHVYFTLKDENAVLNAICWRSQVGKLMVSLEDGIEIVALGRISVYDQRSQYQMIVSQIEIAGEGELLKLLLARRKKLIAEGLFALPKKPLPVLPKMIAVVTSPTGAVIQDILHRITERMPTHLVLCPTRVQGREAADEIASMIFRVAQMQPRPDVLIVARGGGSLEDLWAFNEENVVRAVAACPIPVISAIGHETDWSLLDEVADLRAPTPTAAAEMATSVRHDLLANLAKQQYGLSRAMGSILQNRRDTIGYYNLLQTRQSVLESRMQQLDLASLKLVSSGKQGLTHLTMRFNRIKLLDYRYVLQQKKLQWQRARQNIYVQMQKKIQMQKSQLQLKQALLESFSYRKTLKRGFVLVKDEDARLIKNKKEACGLQTARLVFFDGEMGVTFKKNDA